MKPENIAAGYDGIADIWNGDAFDRGNGIAQHERAIGFVGQKSDRAALDVGCGASGRIIDLLLQHGFSAEGIDLSERMLALARSRHPDVVFHQADICSWTPPRRYDLISAWDSIWHVPLHAQETVLRKLFAHLEPGGIMIFTMGGLDAPSEKTDQAMGPTMYYSTLGIPNTLAIIDDADCVCRHLEFDQPPEPHLYLIVQRAS